MAFLKKVGVLPCLYITASDSLTIILGSHSTFSSWLWIQPFLPRDCDQELWFILVFWYVDLGYVGLFSDSIQNPEYDNRENKDLKPGRSVGIVTLWQKTSINCNGHYITIPIIILIAAHTNCTILISIDQCW